MSSEQKVARPKVYSGCQIFLYSILAKGFLILAKKSRVLTLLYTSTGYQKRDLICLYVHNTNSLLSILCFSVSNWKELEKEGSWNEIWKISLFWHKNPCLVFYNHLPGVFFEVPLYFSFITVLTGHGFAHLTIVTSPGLHACRPGSITKKASSASQMAAWSPQLHAKSCDHEWWTCSDCRLCPNNDPRS